MTRKPDDIVRTEVYYCASSLISEMLQNEKYLNDLLPVLTKPEYSYDCGSCGHTEDCLTEEPEECASCGETLGRGETEQYDREALEHWIISDWLAGKLENHGEMIISDFYGLTIWGRTTSGQQISADYVIEKIASET